MDTSQPMRLTAGSCLPSAARPSSGRRSSG
nr:MAG TPA: hypothetical protein [Caudoviricetes sp.]